MSHLEDFNRLRAVPCVGYLFFAHSVKVTDRSQKVRYMIDCVLSEQANRGRVCAKFKNYYILALENKYHAKTFKAELMTLSITPEDGVEMTFIELSHKQFEECVEFVVR